MPVRTPLARVEPPLVALTVEALRRFFPALRGNAGRVRATVYAGCKQDVDGDPLRRACELVEHDRPLVVALPSVLANALPDARDTVEITASSLPAAASSTWPRPAGHHRAHRGCGGPAGGYDAEEAFGRAFKRTCGAPPSAWRAQRRNSPPTSG